MTVTTTLDRQEFPGDGANKIFPFNFKFLSNSDIYVYLIDASGNVTAQTLGVHYSLTGTGMPGGGTVTMTVAPVSTSFVLVQRVMSATQETSIRNQGRFFPEVHENVFDRLTMLVQQSISTSMDVLRRAIRAPIGESLTDLPNADSRANMVLAFDEAGNPVTIIPATGSSADLALGLANKINPSKGAGQIGYGSSITYPSGTAGEAIGTLEKRTADGFMKEQRSFANFELLSNIGNMTQLNIAILGGSAKIAFIGDSILEGDRDGLYDNSTAAMIMRVLREQNKNVAFTFGNFSLAGRGIGAYSDPNYKGIAGPDNTALGFYRPAGNSLNSQWPGGSVIGKSWMDHVKDFQPDLTIILHGANDASGVASANAAAWKSALDYQNTWAKVPSVAMGTAALPAVSAGSQNEIQVAADVVRGIARERNHTLLDINRIFHLMRDGTDVDNLFYVRNNDFVSYPAGWTPEVGATLALVDITGYALQGSGGALRSVQSQDVNISAKFKMANWTTQTGNIRYRSLGTGADQYTAQVTSGAVFLYYGATIIGSAVISSIPNNTEVTLQVDVRGSLHRVFLNGFEAVSVYDYNNVRPGRHGVSITGGSGLVFELVAHLGNPYSVGLPMLTDTDIYGANDFVANPNTLGGNSINHPTKLANTVIWAHSFAPIFNHIRSLRVASSVDSITPVRTLGSTAFDTASTTLAMEIDGVLGSASGILVPTGGAMASCQDARKVAGNRTIVVRVFHSPGAYFLTTNVVLPAGTWLVTALATFTKDASSVYRNAVVVTAVRTT